MSIAPVTLFDTFSRTQADTWGSLDSGQDWSGEDSSFDTTGSHGVMTVAANAAYKTAYVDLDDFGIPKQTSAEVIILARWSSSSLYPITDFGPMLSRTAAGTFYYATLQYGYGECAIGLYLNGTRYELNRGPFAATKGSYYWMRFRRDATSLKLRIWKLHSTEPSTWTLTSGLWSGSNPPGSGDIGVWRQGSSTSYTAELHQFYGYTLDDEDPGLPVTDTFERTVDDGWGWSDSQHAWEGNYAWDWAVTANVSRGNVTDPGDGRASVAISDTVPRIGIIGPSVSGNIETLAKISMNTNAGQTSIYVGSRGQYRVNAGSTEFTGYFVEVKSNATSINIKKKTSFGGAATTLATSGAITAISNADVYWIRFQIIGTTLQARIWIDGSAEPGTWNVSVTDGSDITSGRGFIATEQSTTSEKEIYIHEFRYQTPTPATTIHTVTGALTSTAITDTTLALRAAFSNDTDSDNSVVVQYKKSTETTYTTFGGTKTRNASPLSWTFTLTGLTPKTQYNVRVTFSDPDTVTGTNPVNATFTTTATGITPGVVTLSAIQATQATIDATYFDDTNNDSTATLDYRITTAQIQFVNDTFTDDSGTLLSAHTPDVGSAWTRHAVASGSTQDIEIVNGRLQSILSTGGQGVTYYNNSVPPSADYTLSCWYQINGTVSRPSLIARQDTAVNTGYLARYNATSEVWEIVRVVTGAFVTVASAPVAYETGRWYLLEFVVTDAYKALLVDGVEVCRTTDNTITGAGRAALRYVANGTFTETTPNSYIDNFVATYRTPAGSWTTGGAMTANRGSKTFSRTQSGLSSDTIYEFRVTYADADGVGARNPQSITGMTIGQAVQLSSLTVSPQYQTAVVEAAYLYDTNNNSSVAIQYRSTMDFLWTTLDASTVLVNRGTKVFSALLPNLKPSTTYEVKVTITDPNGLVSGTPEVLTQLFTTSGYVQESDIVDKYYLWKVYSPDGDYLTTWKDAGTPEFASHENGGVSDLSVTLNRPISAIDHSFSGIDFQNRIDIWCIDPSSDGMGVNLVVDNDFSLGAWTLGANASIDTTGGPDGTSALKLVASGSQVVTRSTPILLREPNSVIDGSTDAAPVPLVVQAIAKAAGSKLVMFVEAYDINDNKIEESDEFAETVGTDWQTLRIEYLPAAKTHSLRVAFKNDGVGTMWADKVQVRAKEVLIYRGRIETFTPEITQTGERISIDILGLISQLSDDYIDFLQFVITQPQKDQLVGRENLGPMDPGDIMRIVLQRAKQQNPYFALYATDDSIRNTGTPVQYTFRNQQIRNVFDKLRSLCPPGWHYFVEPDGKVHLRGPEHGKVHILRRGVEIMNFSVEKSIRNLKNYVSVKGRQDEDFSESDGFGSINYVAFDQESIDRYGKRVLHITDANITDPDTAATIAEGRLEEYNREEQRGMCQIPDEKSIVYAGHALRGYNIEEFRPGDSVIILDPVGGPTATYWDELVWNESLWNFDNIFAPLPDVVPIKTIQFHGSYSRLEVSERQPSGIGDFGRLYRWLQARDSDEGD